MIIIKKSKQSMLERACRKGKPPLPVLGMEIATDPEEHRMEVP